MRATAFLMRSIRQDSRLLSHHMMRGAMAAIILYLFGMQFALFSTRPASGGLFSSTVVSCCYWFLTLVGGIHFSTAIVEEKEEQTLALLKMTGASPFSILAGKSLPRLAMAILFLCVMAPFLVMALTLGGVLPLGLASAILGMCCYSVMLSQMGLLSSVVCRSAPRAFLMTCLLWLAFELSGWWYQLASSLCTYGLRGTSVGMYGTYLLEDILYWIPSCSLLGNLNDNLLAFTTSDALTADDGLFVRLWAMLREMCYFHMGFHLLIGGICFLLSWLLFERCTSRAISEGAFGAPREVLAVESRSRVWNHAVEWKSWQHASGGRLWFWLRAVGMTVLIVVAVLCLASFDRHVDTEFVAGMTTVFGIGFFLINLARLFGRVLNAEIHGKTLASLVMLPRKTSQTLWAMIVGLLPAVGAGAVCAVVGFSSFMWLSIDSVRDVENLIEALFQPWVWHIFTWILLTIHLGLLLTTHIRYGGMLIGVVLLWMVAPMCCGSLFSLMAFSGGAGFGRGAEDFFQYLVPLGLIVAEIAACCFLQIAILKRVEIIASQ